MASASRGAARASASKSAARKSASKSADTKTVTEKQLRRIYGERDFHKVKIRKKTFIIDTRYTNLEQIGDGAYGVVCSAYDKVLQRKVAIKKVADVFEDLVDAKRILREILLLRHLGEHPNITSILDVTVSVHAKPEKGRKEDPMTFKDLYIITDLYECDLDRIVTSKQVLTRPHIQFFLYQILKGLKYIHSASVMHRDLKPSNILVNSDCALAICDFGLSRGAHDEASLTDYVVTRWYRAPEILCDNKLYDEKVDVWSAGLIFAELLLRRPLLQGKDYVHQLKLIVKLLGRPDSKDLECIASKEARDAIARFTYAGTNFSSLFDGQKDDAIDLLKSMLHFNPNKRLTVQQALEHPYLSELHADKTEPQAERVFDSSFEKQYATKIKERTLRHHLFEQVLIFSFELKQLDAKTHGRRSRDDR